MASLALRALRRCRRLASAPGAARLVFNMLNVYFLKIFFKNKEADEDIEDEDALTAAEKIK